ncbi:unnamed protein product [Rotaria sordida]|uniref:Sodium/potassium-transporting ATPase subunit beta n=1 Tax=Rotaria sordida TaxID=392033 RepID=A0A814FZ95_9BILA|nr:unnamed protein product [Rotaria sordida]CAF3803249.1 unnamed protein product [Rotaria sordida]
MGGRVSSFMNALYNPKRKQFLGRDGAGWTKLGVFYFFFYLGLAGFFCAMLAVFMALSPRDRPRYYLEESRMATRSNPLSPGLGFRPQPEADKNLIIIDKNARPNEPNVYAKSLDQYLQIFYWKEDKVEKAESDDEDDDPRERPVPTRKFIINKPGDCTNATQYGFAKGKPCVLVKMNKIVGFKPKPGAPDGEKKSYISICKTNSTAASAVYVHCYGEYPADEDNIGNITYISENGRDTKCGALETSWFPYEGKINREDKYQAPYIWVQFNSPSPNILINVVCRVYGQNIDFDKKTGRAITRFQIYVKDLPEQAASRLNGDI